MEAAIIGIGMTTIEKCKVEATYADLAWEAVNKALDDAGLGIDDIDNVITTSSDFWDGRTISCMAVGDASGVRYKNCSAVEGDGTFGAAYALARSLSGDYKTTLVTAHSKVRKVFQVLLPMQHLTLSMNAGWEWIWYRHAQCSRAYMHTTGTTSEQLALVSCKIIKMQR
jgi:Acetyl-CoA acetyltransferase